MDLGEIKSARWRSCPGDFSILCIENVDEVLFGPCSSTDIDEGAGDRADHVIKKTVCLNFEADEVSGGFIHCSFRNRLFALFALIRIRCGPEIPV